MWQSTPDLLIVMEHLLWGPRVEKIFLECKQARNKRMIDIAY